MAEPSNIHAGHRERIRQRFREQGLSGFAEHEVLELLLTFVIARRDVNPLAHELLAQFGSLSAVLEANETELMRVRGVGENTAALLSLMPELFRYYQRNALGERPVVSTVAQAKAYCRSLFFGAHEEMAYVLCLDQHGRVIHPALLRRGTVDEVAIYPREVVEMVIRYHACSVLLTHNHPGGTARPSPADYTATRSVARALAAIGVQMMDHLILTDTEVYSMKREIMAQGWMHGGAGTSGALREQADDGQYSLDQLLLRDEGE